MSIRSVKKAIQVLQVVVEAPKPVTLSEVVTQTGFPAATAHRLLGTLTQARLLAKEDKLYSPGIHLFELGKRAEQRMDLASLAMPHLRALRDTIGESVNLAILDKTDVVYIASVESPRIMRTFTVPGARIPCHCTGVGKVLLSGRSDEELETLYGLNGGNSHKHVESSKSATPAKLKQFTLRTITCPKVLMEEIKKARILGYAMDECEREDGVVCVAAPVQDHAGHVVAAVSISGPTSRLDKDSLAKTSSHVIGCARTISREFGVRLGERL